MGDYTLTMKTPHRNKHFRIIADSSGTYRIGPQLFHSLDDLVEHYTKHPIYRLGAEKLYLVKPFSKSPSALATPRSNVTHQAEPLDPANMYDM